jgi:hypothetical protein
MNLFRGVAKNCGTFYINIKRHEIITDKVTKVHNAYEVA